MKNQSFFLVTAVAFLFSCSLFGAEEKALVPSRNASIQKRLKRSKELNLTEARQEARRLGQEFRKHVVLADKLLQHQDWELHPENLSEKTKEELQKAQEILDELSLVPLRNHRELLLTDKETKRVYGIKEFGTSAVAFFAAMAAGHFLPNINGIMQIVEFFSVIGAIDGASDILATDAAEKLTGHQRGRLGQWLLDRKVRKTEALVLAEFVEGVGALKLASAQFEIDSNTVQSFHNLIAEMEATHDCNMALNAGSAGALPEKSSVENE